MEKGLLDGLFERLGRPPRVLPPGYLSFVKKEVSYLFPKGWDAAYEGFCLTTSPPLSSCVEAGRSKGGALGALGLSQYEYLDRVLFGKGGKLLPYYAGKVMVVSSAGKPRPLSKFPAESLYLRPVHKTIYDALSRKSWLLRGDVTEEALDKAGFVEGKGRLVSGDYVSATDNLPIEVMELALDVMLKNASFIPPNVKELAKRAVRPILFSDGESLEVSVGQMMGSYLSFPFLCLQNRLAVVWALKSAGFKPKDVPMLINGDDILFQEPAPGFSKTWFRVVAGVGLLVEETKTSVSTFFGSINSTLLEWRNARLRRSWTARLGMFRACEVPNSLGNSFHDFLKGCPRSLLFPAAREWFKWHIAELRSAMVSLTSLGFRGLLALRFARMHGLDQYPTADLPTLDKHGVVASGDFVTRVPASAVDDELKFAGALELAAGKWNEGWDPGDRTRRALQYCLKLTQQRSLSRPFDFAGPLLGGLGFLGLNSREFSVRMRSFQGAPVLRYTRRQLVRSYLSPFPVQDWALVPTNVVLGYDAVLGLNELPAYSVTAREGEFVEVEGGFAIL